MRITHNGSKPMELGSVTLQVGVNEVDAKGFESLRTEHPKLRRACEKGVVVVDESTREPEEAPAQAEGAKRTRSSTKQKTAGEQDAD